MNKSKLLVLPLIFMLTSCQEVKFGFEQGVYSSGLDKEVSSAENEAPSYSYKKNDTLDNTGLNQAVLTFTNIKESASDIQDVEKIAQYLHFSQEIFSSVVSPKYVGVKDNGTFFIGAESTYVDGSLSFNFNVAIKNVEIKAKPYFYVKTAYNEEELMVDSEVAISVNNTGFIKLDETKDNENVTVAQSTCTYHLPQESQTITLKVGKRRAIIDQITSYY